MVNSSRSPRRLWVSLTYLGIDTTLPASYRESQVKCEVETSTEKKLQRKSIENLEGRSYVINSVQAIICGDHTLYC